MKQIIQTYRLKKTNTWKAFASCGIQTCVTVSGSTKEEAIANAIIAIKKFRLENGEFLEVEI